MKAIRLLALSFLLSGASFAQTELQTEHLTQPLGIDAPHPRLSWRLNDPTKGATQTAYALVLGSDSGAVAAGRGNWQTGRHEGNTQRTTYNGPALPPFTRYYWRVTVWDKNGRPAKGPVAFFETSLMDQNNWQGNWITDTKDIGLKPAAYFRRAFTLHKTLRSARVYIAAAGLYELSINGQRVGDHVLDPMYTRFDRRTLYVTYDVTLQLRSGDNAIGVLLGNGWYNLSSTAVWHFDKAPWRARPSFCLDLRLTYTDGTTETITTGRDWKTTLSPVVFNSIYTGEHVDDRLDMPHWDEPDFTDTAWHDIIYAAAPSQHIVSQSMVPVRITDTIPALSIKRFSDTDYSKDGTSQ